MHPLLNYRIELRAPENPKTYYVLEWLPEFEGRFPEILKLMTRIGMHPQQRDEQTNPYTGEPAGELFANVGTHCIAVANAAEKIASWLLRRGASLEPPLSEIVKRALSHDIAKPHEIMRKNAQKAGLFRGDAYAASAYESVSLLLRNSGISKELREYIAHAGSETGHISLRSFIQVRGDEVHLVPGRLADKIIHHADDMTFTELSQSGGSVRTMYLTPGERMFCSEFRTRYPFLWTQGLAVDESGATIDIKDITDPPPRSRVIGSYIDVQGWVALKICGELCQLAREMLGVPSLQRVKEIVNG